MIGGNLIEIVAGLAAFGTSASLFSSIYTLKILTTPDTSTSDADVHAAEYGWRFNMAWLLSCFLVPTLFTAIFTEIYEALDITDAATSVLSLLWVYLLLMALWVYAQFIFPTYRWIAYVLLVGALIVAGAEGAYIFVTLHSTHWYHWIILLFALPPLFAFASTWYSNTFRDRHAVARRQQKLGGSRFPTG